MGVCGAGKRSVGKGVVPGMRGAAKVRVMVLRRATRGVSFMA